MNRQVSGLKTSAYWRERAEEARTKGEGVRNHVARATMLEIAQRNDPMAERAAKREASRDRRDWTGPPFAPDMSGRLAAARRLIEAGLKRRPKP